jgi:hypothetical protein
MSRVPRHRVLAIVGVVFLVIAAERLVNMILIGRPLAEFVVRAWVFQWSVALGIVLLIVAALIRRDH